MATKQIKKNEWQELIEKGVIETYEPLEVEVYGRYTNFWESLGVEDATPC